MGIPKQKIKIKIKTDSTIVVGHIHIAIGGRVSDFITSHVDKFIPVTEAKAYPIDNSYKKSIDICGSYDVIFINVKSIAMMSIEGVEQTINEKDIENDRF